MGEAIDWLREEWPWSDVEPSDSECIGVGITPADLARAIDEYDAAAATAGRLMAENAELRDLVADTAAACAVWRKRAEAAEAKLANLRPHPEDEADIIEAVRQAKAGEGVSYLTWEETEALFGIREDP